jgi:hypothetical protein
MRVPTVGFGPALILGYATLCMADTTRATLDVWPGKAPGEIGSADRSATTILLPEEY